MLTQLCGMKLCPDGVLVIVCTHLGMTIQAKRKAVVFIIAAPGVFWDNVVHFDLDATVGPTQTTASSDRTRRLLRTLAENGIALSKATL